jgi:hypothetical protein
MAEPSVRRSGVEREFMWVPWEEPGLELLRLATSDGVVVANRLVIGPGMSLLRTWEAFR